MIQVQDLNRELQSKLPVIYTNEVAIALPFKDCDVTDPKQTMLSLDIENYEVSQDYGFLPSQSPAQAALPKHFHPIEEMAALLPKWLILGRIRQTIERLPEVNVEQEPLDDLQLRRAMLMYSYLTHAYVWGESSLGRQAPPATLLPRNIAVPFYAIAEKIGRPPVLSYASYALDNWVRIDAAESMQGHAPPGTIAIGNIRIFQNFLGGLDEDWFILIHIDIEAKAAPALAAIPKVLAGIDQEKIPEVIDALEIIKAAWIRINETMNRMPEACDPYIYYNRVRPYIHGWKNNPSLPDGLIYQGVAAYREQPQQFRGETGAQSAIVPTMDALFNITHDRDRLWEFLMEMREYMPPKHRAFIKAVEQRSSLRNFVKRHLEQFPKLRERYDDCVSLIEQFRTRHLEFAARYIQQQATRANNDTQIGTGGTPFMRYLKKHRDESNYHLLKQGVRRS